MSGFLTDCISRPQASSSLEVHLLGAVDFDSAVFLQERLLYEISERTDTQGGLLLCEHPPIITIGREGSSSHILADEQELISRQIEVRWLNRGGGCIVHAPGQLAVYPVVPLGRLQLGLEQYRARLERSVMDVCSELHVPAHRRRDKPGVWCRGGKFTDLGIAVRSWVAYHGMYINVAPAMEVLELVESRSAGSVDRVTSLAATRVRRVPMHVVREGIVRHLARQLGYERYHVYTGHPLLKRTTRRVYVNA
ncbi:MAG: lipoyl(octanoyl) transferase LipB [Planctomycetaceae bacterium]